LGTSVIQSPGSVTLRSGAAGGGISQAGGGKVIANKLYAGYNGVGTIGFSGDNEVNYVTLLAPNGDVNYNSYKSFHLENALAGAAPGVAITTVSGSPNGGDVAIGTITTTGNRAVNVTAYGGIYDDNAGAVNISTGSGNISLTSYGGHAPDLAISMDTSTTGALNATVALSAGNSGGISLRNTAASNPASITVADNGSMNQKIDFHAIGDLTLDGSQSFTTSNGGNIFIASSHDLIYNVGTPPVSTGTGTGIIGFHAANDLTVTSDITRLETLAFGAGNLLQINGLISSSAGDLNLAGSTVIVNGKTAESQTGKTNVMAGMLKVSGANGKLLAGTNIDIAAGDIVVDNSGLIKAQGGNVNALVFNDVRVNSGGVIEASDDVKLMFLSGDSTLYLNDTPGMSPASKIKASPNTVHLHFAGRSNGGIVIDGVETQDTIPGMSGFYSGATPLFEGAGLEITYGITGLEAGIVKAILKALDDSDDLAPPPPPVGGGPTQLAAGDQSVGGGENEFGEKKDGDKDDHNGNGRGKNGDERNEKRGGKHVGQCS
jgi:hypothetical protein